MKVNKKIIASIATVIISISLFSATYIYNVDDPRIEIKSVYTITHNDGDSYSAINEKGHLVNLPKNEFYLTNSNVGDEFRATIFINRIVNVYDVNNIKK